MIELSEIAKHIACEFRLTYNQHKGYYIKEPEAIKKEYMTMLPQQIGVIDWTKDIWYIQIYPYTPIGFSNAVSNDLKALLDWGVSFAKGEL